MNTAILSSPSSGFALHVCQLHALHWALLFDHVGTPTARFVNEANSDERFITIRNLASISSKELKATLQTIDSQIVSPSQTTLLLQTGYPKQTHDFHFSNGFSVGSFFSNLDSLYGRHDRGHKMTPSFIAEFSIS